MNMKGALCQGMQVALRNRGSLFLTVGKDMWISVDVEPMAWMSLEADSFLGFPDKKPSPGNILISALWDSKKIIQLSLLRTSDTEVWEDLCCLKSLCIWWFFYAVRETKAVMESMKPVSCGTQVSLLVGSPRVPQQTWWYTVGASGEWWTWWERAWWGLK